MQFVDRDEARVTTSGIPLRYIGLNRADLFDHWAPVLSAEPAEKQWLVVVL